MAERDYTRLFRRDRGIDYYWNGTYWVSELRSDIIRGPDTGYTSSSSGLFSPVAHPGVYDLLLRSADLVFYIIAGTALDASNKWDVSVTKRPSGTVIASWTIDSGSLNTWRSAGADVIDALNGLTDFAYQVAWTKTGTPGTLVPLIRINYRLKG